MQYPCNSHGPSDQQHGPPGGQLRPHHGGVQRGRGQPLLGGGREPAQRLHLRVRVLGCVQPGHRDHRVPGHPDDHPGREVNTPCQLITELM